MGERQAHFAIGAPTPGDLQIFRFPLREIMCLLPGRRYDGPDCLRLPASQFWIVALCCRDGPYGSQMSRTSPMLNSLTGWTLSPQMAGSRRSKVPKSTTTQGSLRCIMVVCLLPNMFRNTSAEFPNSPVAPVAPWNAGRGGGLGV